MQTKVLKTTDLDFSKNSQLPPKFVETPPSFYEEGLKEREEIVRLLSDQLEATETELLRMQANNNNKVEVPDLRVESRRKHID